MKRVLIFLLALGLVWTTTRAADLQIRVIDTKGQVLEGAVISSPGAMASAVTNAEGKAILSLQREHALLTVECKGFYTVQRPARPGQSVQTIVLISEEADHYSPTSSLNKKDMTTSLTIDQALSGSVAGLQVVGKSGMPGEGAYFNIEGIHSLEAENAPLIVLNGVPYLKDNTVSSAIGGYSRSLFSAININDVKDIKVLRGAEAAQYGSLGSNGVILIETEQAGSVKLDTRISFSEQFGVAMKGRTVQTLDADQYKNYLREVGMTLYDQMNHLTTDYPFLQTSTDYPTSYIFANNTDWQKEIYRPGLVDNSVLRVEGGDEIAKYNLGIGYTTEGGSIEGTNNERYHALLNADITVGRRFDIFSSICLSYSRSRLQEQGMSQETNPMLASWLKMPVLNPYYAGSDGNLTSTYATYDFGNINEYPQHAYENVSNPTAIVNTLEAKDKLYDVNILLGLNYQATDHLRFTGEFNRQYRYVEENLFIPGKTNQAIYPQYYGIGRNTVRKAVAESRNTYFALKGAYQNVFADVFDFSVQGGGRYMKTNSEYDMSSGYNTPNDFYKTLDKTVDERNSDGYIHQWIWTNFYLNAHLTWNHLLQAGVWANLDGSSVSGTGAPRFYLYPSARLTFLAGNLNGMPDWIRQLDLHVEYAMTGNSRFSSNLAKNYYSTSNFFSMGSIIRSDIPNVQLEPEKQHRFSAGLESSMLRHRLQWGVEAYRSHAYDLIMPQAVSSVYASKKYYENAAAVNTNGLTAHLRAALVDGRLVGLTLGGNVSFVKSRVAELGEQTYTDITFEEYNLGDDVIVRLQEGEEPYQFYGYATNGIYTTAAEAAADGLQTVYNTSFQAGDVRFVNQNNDKKINEQDKVLLGSSRPDCFGAVFATLRVQRFSLTAQMNYSIGGKIYNAVRRQLESMDHLYNQSTSVLNRWQMEGQQANLPRAAWGDPSGNNLFSDRWLEDASYAKLSRLCLSYALPLSATRYFMSGTFWIAGENLLTLTRYLGNDPELSYSQNDFLYGIDYAKVPHPRTVKIGFNLNF